MIIDKDKVDIFKLGASYTIGSHILPGQPIANISSELKKKVKLDITSCDKIIESVKSNIYEMGLIETPIFDRSLVYRKWLEDELVICSKTPLPKEIGADEIKNYRLIARKPTSLTRIVISNFFKKINLSYQNFKSITEIYNATATIQSVKWSKPNIKNPTVAIVSKIAIEDELKRGDLYMTRIKNSPIIRDFYLIYNKRDYYSNHIDEIIKILKSAR